MSLDKKLKSDLMLIAIGMVQHGYTPENKGNYEAMHNPEISPRTPDNFIATYKELLEKFMDVDKLVG